MRLTFGNLSLDGVSRGGDRTWFRVQPPGLAFDVGRGDVALSGVRHVFLSHGHLDHCLGLPFLLSYRARHRGGPTQVACPMPLAGPLAEFLALAAQLENATYDFELRGLEPGDQVEVAPDQAVEAFATSHVVPSLGYHLVRRKRRLMEIYRELPGVELAALREEGVQLEEELAEDWLSYTGDSSVEVLDSEPRLLGSKILLIECTFLDPEHRDRAKRYGHVHIDDLAERVERFDNETIVLFHLSRRHDVGELENAVKQRLAPLAERLRWVVA